MDKFMGMSLEYYLRVTQFSNFKYIKVQLVNMQCVVNVIGSEGTDTYPDNETDDNDELLGILNISQPCTEFGENLSDAVAKSFDRMVTHRPAKEKIEKWSKDLKPPENCKVLAVPRVNPEIWP